MREQLNALIVEAEYLRCLRMPRIGAGHAMCPGGIFSLLQDPGSPHTAGSGAQRSLVVDIDNDDPTARYCRELYARLGIAKGLITPWNAFGAYGEKPGMQAIRDNLPLCRALVEVARPAALIAQGRWAHKTADLLGFKGPVLRVPHPSRLGRASYTRWHRQDPDAVIEAAFEAAFRVCQAPPARRLDPDLPRSRLPTAVP